MPFLPLFTGIRHLAHVLTVPPTKACLLCATPFACFLGALRPLRRDGLLGTGTGEEGGERVKARPRTAPTLKTEEAVDRRQKNQKC